MNPSHLIHLISLEYFVKCISNTTLNIISTTTIDIKAICDKYKIYHTNTEEVDNILIITFRY